MGKSKFKVGDKVKIKGKNDTYEIASVREYFYFGKPTDTCICDLKGTLFSVLQDDLELLEPRTYTGIELLQAIKDRELKDGDKFEVYLNGTYVDEAKILDNGYRLRIKSMFLLKGDLSLSDILDCEFKPIKKEPINTAKANKVLNIKIPVDILGKRELIDARVIIKDNKIVVKFLSGIKGVASCCPEDKFDEQKGIKIASARAIKKQIINDLDKNIAELVK